MAAILQGVGKLAATAGFVGVAVNSCIYNVDAGCRGVIFDRFRGVLQDVKQEGEKDGIEKQIRDYSYWCLSRHKYHKFDCIHVP